MYLSYFGILLFAKCICKQTNQETKIVTKSWSQCECIWMIMAVQSKSSMHTELQSSQKRSSCNSAQGLSPANLLPHINSGSHPILEVGRKMISFQWLQNNLYHHPVFFFLAALPAFLKPLLASASTQGEYLL